MGIQEFPSKPVNKGSVVIGTVNGPTEVAVGADNSYLVADSTTTPGAKWNTFRQYVGVQLTSGTTWTVPATVSVIDVLVIGAGQGGNGCSSAATANANRNADGGAGGAYVYQKDYPVTPGATITYSIGAGGAGGSAAGVNTTNQGGIGGNTTFGAIVAPGGGNKVGTRRPFANTTGRQRGVYDVYYNDFQFDGTAYSSSVYFAGTGMPDGPGAEITGSLASGAASAFGFTQPYSKIEDTSTAMYSNSSKPHGITGTYNKLLSLFTAPQGSASNTNEHTTYPPQRLAGWAGWGATGQVTAGINYLTPPAFHGAGGAGSINSSTTGTARAANGGAAAANSGAGGGGSSVQTGSAAAATGATGGAGGSGVIFIGYWV